MLAKGISCLTLAIGGAALAATAPASVPLTAAAIAGSLMTGVAGTKASELFGSGEELATAILRGDPGIDNNHHIIHAFRQAHLKALQKLLKNYEEASRTDLERRDEHKRYAEELRGFLKRAGARLPAGGGPAQEFEKQVFAGLGEAFDAALASRGNTTGRSVEKASFDARRDIEVAVLAEVTLQTGSDDVPALFKQTFDANENGWFDLFVRDAAHQLKSNESFRSIWTAEKLAGIDQQVARFGAQLDRIEQNVQALVEAFAEAHQTTEGERRLVVQIARIVNREVDDFQQAINEIEGQMRRVADAIARGEAPTNEGDLLHLVRQQIANDLKAENIEGPSRRVDAALSELERRRADRDEAEKRETIALLEEGVSADLLRRDAAAAAGRIAKQIELQSDHGPERATAFNDAVQHWHIQGGDLGIDLDLEVAIEIAKCWTNSAESRFEFGAAVASLASAQSTLAETSWPGVAS